MRLRYRNWTENLNVDWCVQPPALLRRAVPGLVPARRRRRSPTTSTRSSRRRDALPVDPTVDVPPGYAPTQRDRAGRLHRRGRRLRHLVHELADAADRLGLGARPGAPRRSASPPTSGRRATRSSARGPSTRSRRRCCTSDTSRGTTSSISGWILDPDRKKMSKSKGNVVTPMHLLDEYSVRRRALLGRERAPRHRHRLRREGAEGREAPRHQALQRRQVRARAGGAAAPIDVELDRAFVERLRALVDAGHGALRGVRLRARAAGDRVVLLARLHRHLPRAREAPRARDDAGGSAIAALRLGLGVLLRLFAPVLPYVTEEVWSWVFADGDRASEHPPRAVADGRRARRPWPRRPTPAVSTSPSRVSPPSTRRSRRPASRRAAASRR